MSYQNSGKIFIGVSMPESKASGAIVIWALQIKVNTLYVEELKPWHWIPSVFWES